MPAKKTPPFFQADYEVADATALKALQAGTADADQQQRALGWILNEGCRIKDVTFQPDSDRTSAFAEGRRFVGLQIAKLLSVSTRDLLLQEQRKPKQG